MKKTLFPVALFGALAALSAPAHAETFNGPYIGVAAGWDRSEVASRTILSQPVDAEVSRDALVLGGYAGYNYRATDRIVVGAEAGFNMTIDDKVRATSASRTLTVDPRYSFDLTARAGYLVADKALVYARGGYTNARIHTSLNTSSGLVRAEDNLDGWLVGGGVEYAITPEISARAEYRYNDFGQNGGQYDRHQALVGVSYNF